MAIWDEVIPAEDRRIYAESGLGQTRIGFGNKPAFLIVDVTYGFVGDRPEPIRESMIRFPLSCGEKGWKAVAQISGLLPLVRQKRVPIFYSVLDLERKPDGWLDKKSSRIKEYIDNPAGNEIVREIAPAGDDLVIAKSRGSMFFGTTLSSMLNGLRVDTLLVCGVATGGCIRSTVTDAWAHNFRVALIEECTFDKAEITHKVNLFEMNAKYCDVITVAQAKEYMKSL